MVHAQILRYISRPKYTRQSPDCPLVIFSFTALPSCLHCSTSYSSAFAQHCIVAPPAITPCCTRVHPHRLHPSRVSPSDPVSLLQVRPLPIISSESQHSEYVSLIFIEVIKVIQHECLWEYGYVSVAPITGHSLRADTYSTTSIWLEVQLKGKLQ